MSQQGYCNDLKNQGLNTYNSTSYGYNPGTSWGCGDQGLVAGYVVEYVFPDPDDGSRISDDVYICEAGFGPDNNLGSTLAHEAHHQVSGDGSNHTEGDSWGSQCTGS